jgi:tetratricopeptide (TPR) repeat protein
VDEVLAAHARAEKDRDMLARLEEARLRQGAEKEGRFDQGLADPLYEDAFRSYGLDRTRLSPTEVAALVTASAIRDDLVSALNDWSYVKRAAKSEGQQWVEGVLQRTDSDKWRARFRAAHARGDRQELRRLVRQPEVRNWPPSLLTLLAEVLLQVDAADAAVELLEPAQQRHPQDFWINHNLAYALSALPPGGRNRVEEAIGYYRVAVALKPDSPGAHLNLGDALMEQGRFAAAEAAYRKALECKPGYVPALINLGGVHTKMGLLAEAEKNLQEAIRLDPRDADGHYNLGVLRATENRPAEGVAAFEKARELRPNHAPTSFNIGILQFQAGNLPAAETALREAIRRNVVPAHFVLGTDLLQQGRLAEAEAVFRDAVRLQADHAEAHCNLGHVLVKQGKLAAGLDSLRRGHDLGSRRPGWSYPSARWVQDTERMIRLEA